MIEVKFRSKTYNLFDEISLNTSLDNLVGQFSLSTTLKNEIPFGLDDFIQIMVNGQARMSGYIEKAAGSISNSATSITWSGRDLLGDLVDSSIPDSVSVNDKAISLEGLCTRTIKALKIKSTVINKAGSLASFTEAEIEAIGFGGRAAEFLQSFARKRSVFLITEGDGNLVIFTPPTKLSVTEKLTINSMLPREFDYDNSRRFNIIRVASQDNNAASDSADLDDGVSRTQSFQDTDIRASRYLEIVGEETMSNAELKHRAEEEVNIRRAKGFSYSFDVPNHNYRIGQLIPVEDELGQITGNFLVKGVNYKQNLSGGNTSRLTVCFPESYSGVGKRVTKRKAKMSRKGKLSVDLDAGTLLVDGRAIQL